MKQEQLRTPDASVLHNKLTILRGPYIPNREVIGAIDSALNRVDSDIRLARGRAPLLIGLREERAALVEARNFIADKRSNA